MTENSCCRSLTRFSSSSNDVFGSVDEDWHLRSSGSSEDEFESIGDVSDGGRPSQEELLGSSPTPSLPAKFSGRQEKSKTLVLHQNRIQLNPDRSSRDGVEQEPAKPATPLTSR